MLYYLLALYACNASTYVLTKLLITSISSDLIVLIRLALSALLCAGIYIYSAGKKNLILPKNQFGWLILIAFFSAYATNMCITRSIETLSSSQAALIFALNPLIIASIAWFLGWQSLTKMKMLGLCLGWAGLFPITCADHASFGSFSYGELWAIGAAASTAIGALILQHYLKQGISPDVANIWLLFLGAGIQLVTVSNIGEASHFSSHVYALLLLLGIMNAISAWGFTRAVLFYGVTTAALWGNTIPLFSALYDFTLFGIMPSGAFFISLSLIGLGLYLFTKK